MSALPSILAAYAVKPATTIREPEAAELVRGAHLIAGDLAPRLGMFLSLKGVRKWFDAKVRWGYPFAHLAGEISLDEAIRIAEGAARIDDDLAAHIKRHPKLARIEVYRNQDLLFTQAFELAPGFQAYEDIDLFRVRSRMRAPVLAPSRHGDHVGPNADLSLAGYFESSVVRRVCVPVIDQGLYLADCCGSYYK